MSELNFAKSFLQTLDGKPSRYSPNHVFDPKTFATRIPFTLPKLPQPPHPTYPKTRPSAPPAPGATSATATTTTTTTRSTISLNLKSSRNPALAMTLSEVDPATTTIARLRESVQDELGGSAVVAVEKIKILFNKRPVPASKRTVRDVLEGDDGLGQGGTVEMGVMVMGGAPDPPARTGGMPGGEGGQAQTKEAAQAPAAPPPRDMEGIEQITRPTPVLGPSGKEVLETDEFWKDLQGFLEQRIKDETQAARLVHRWKGSWKEG